jgi:hypothetical protein
MKRFLILILISLPVLLTAQQISYAWSTGETTASISPTPYSTTTYYVTVTQYGVQYVDSITISIDTDCPIIWKGQGNWILDSLNWSTHRVPVQSDSVLIDSGWVSIDTSIYIKHIVIDTNTEVRVDSLDGQLIITNSLNKNGEINVSNANGVLLQGQTFKNYNRLGIKNESEIEIKTDVKVH